MPIGIVVIDVVVIVLPVFRSRIIRRIDVDHVHFLRMGVGEDGESMVVVAFDEDVRRSGGIVGDREGVVGDEYGELRPASGDDVFGLVLPDETIAFGFFELLELTFELFDLLHVFGLFACFHECDELFEVLDGLSLYLVCEVILYGRLFCLSFREGTFEHG